MLLFTGGSAQQRSMLQRQASRVTLIDAQLSRNLSNESIHSQRSGSSGASSPSRIAERRGSAMSMSSDGSASGSTNSSTNELLSLFSDLGKQVSAAAPQVVEDDDGVDGSWETALSQLERMDPVGKIVDLQMAISVRLSLSLAGPSSSGEFVAPPFVDVELDRVDLRATKRLKYTQAAVKVVALNVFDNTGAPALAAAAAPPPSSPRRNSVFCSSLAATTVPRLQHFRRQGVSELDGEEEEDPESAFIDLVFEHPQLSPGLRQQYPLVVCVSIAVGKIPSQAGLLAFRERW